MQSDLLKRQMMGQRHNVQNVVHISQEKPDLKHHIETIQEG